MDKLSPCRKICCEVPSRSSFPITESRSEALESTLEGVTCVAGETRLSAGGSSNASAKWTKEQKKKKGDENIREGLKSRQTTIRGLMGSETGVGEAGTGENGVAYHKLIF